MVVAAAAQLALGGCYSFTRVEPGEVSPGSDVRIRVDRSVSLSLGAVPLPEDGGVVEGKLVRSASPDTLMCDVLLAPRAEGVASLALRGTVSIPAGAVEAIELRRLDPVRTGGLVAGGLALAWVIVDHAFDIHNGREGTDNTGGTDNARIVLFRLRR